MSQNNRFHDRVIALSAVVQVASLVQQIAETGQANSSEVETMLQSLLVENADSTVEVYQNLSSLKTGLYTLTTLLSKKREQRDVILLRYVIGLLHLERQLSKQNNMLDMISDELAELPKQIAYFGTIQSPQAIARLGDLYHRTLSELSPRIQVFGEQTYLEQPDNVNKIRALLLAGIRAAVLWHQKGGRRWQIILQPGKILSTANDLYQTI